MIESKVCTTLYVILLKNKIMEDKTDPPKTEKVYLEEMNVGH